MADLVMAIGATIATGRKWRAKPSLKRASVSFPAMAMTDDDLDAAIVQARVRGVPEREICRELGCSPEQVCAALSEAARRKLAPENIERMLGPTSPSSGRSPPPAPLGLTDSLSPASQLKPQEDSAPRCGTRWIGVRTISSNRGWRRAKARELHSQSIS
jgi:hypothetical protein